MCAIQTFHLSILGCAYQIFANVQERFFFFFLTTNKLASERRRFKVATVFGIAFSKRRAIGLINKHSSISEDHHLLRIVAATLHFSFSFFFSSFFFLVT